MDILFCCIIGRSGYLTGKNEPCRSLRQDLHNGLEYRRMERDHPDRGYRFTIQNGTDLHLISRFLDLDKQSACTSYKAADIGERGNMFAIACIKLCKFLKGHVTDFSLAIRGSINIRIMHQ